MGKPEYDNQGNVVKKKVKIKIAGFTIRPIQIIAVLILIAVVVIGTMVSNYERDKRDAEETARKQAELEAALNSFNNGPELDLHAQIQAQLTSQYGVAPDGFEWDYTGNLVPLGNDDDHNCEDVVYMYLRAVSMLDFSTAARYSESSSIISTYQGYYGIVTEAITDYYRNFLRKQYKLSLTSLEVEGISDIAVFADGSEYLTVTIKCLDLSDKDFWVKDRDVLFDKMRVYKETEVDSVKVEQYVYDYMLEKYEEGAIPKKSHTIELVVSKDSGSGWLVSGDKELDAYLQYENGVDVARYILDEFSTWYTNTLMQEQLEQIGAVGGSENNIPADGSLSGDEFDEGSDSEWSNEADEGDGSLKE